MKRVLRFALVAAVMFGSGGVAIAEQAKPAPTYEQAILNQWRSLHNKILTMAKTLCSRTTSSDGSRIPIRAAC
jgi:hypothetical protein